jgi:hypothetical protein
MNKFEEWWEGDIATPPMPEIDLYPTSPFTKRRIYYGCSTSAAKAIWEAGWEAAMNQSNVPEAKGNSTQ